MKTLLPFALVVAVVAAAACGNVQVTPAKKELCSNGLDDNGDGKTDCLDPTCFSNPGCQRLV